MNYDKTQFEVLKNTLKLLKKHIDLATINPHNLHFIVYQQFSEGQKHNRLIVDKEGNLKRKFSLVGDKLVENEGELLVNTVFDFLLYPQNCNDNHIETAVKKAIKELDYA